MTATSESPPAHKNTGGQENSPCKERSGAQPTQVVGLTGDLRAWALAWAAAGWAMLPLTCNASGRLDKHPGRLLKSGYFDKPLRGTDEVDAWCRDARVHGFGVLPPVGIDVDDGRRLDVHQTGWLDKHGADTLARWEAAHGPLPATYRLSSRRDGINGIRLFAPPLGFDPDSWREWWDGTGRAGASGDIDIVRPGYRHAFAVGIHPDHGLDDNVIGSPALYGPEGNRLDLTDPLPSPSDLPPLPEAWMQHLAKECDCWTGQGSTAHSTAGEGFLGANPGTPEAVISGAGQPAEVGVERIRALLTADGWRKRRPPDRGTLAAFDHPEATAAYSGKVRQGHDRVRLHVHAGSAALRGHSIESGTSHSVWDLLLIANGADEQAAKAEAIERGWLPDTSTEKDSEVIWDERPILAHIRQAAHSRGVSAWAVLATFLARYCAEVHPRHVLPPLVGTRMSLNTFVALLGPSGAGKSSVIGVVEDLAEWATEAIGAGSGEGLLRGYGDVEKRGGKWKQTKTASMVTVDEVASLTAQTDRSGQTLLGLLNTGWTGARLSQPYATTGKGAKIDPHGYRMAVVVGVQLGKADGLLDHADAGTPQRFIWAPLVDATIPEPRLRPEWPGAITVYCPPADGELIDLPVTQAIAVEIMQAAHERNTRWDKPGSNGEGGHDNLTRLKAAGLLALLDDRHGITDDDWRIAGMLMIRSRDALRRVAQDRRHRDEQAAVAKGVMQGRVSAVADRIKEDTGAQRLAQRIGRHVHAHDLAGGCVKKCAKGRAKRDGLGDVWDEALAIAVCSQWVRVEERPHPRKAAETIAYYLAGAVKP